jgi:hypothetical protein
VPNSFNLYITGRNLCDTDRITEKTINGVTISYNSTTKEITLNGTTSANGVFSYNLIEPIIINYTTGYKRKFWYVSGSFSTTGNDTLYIRMQNSMTTLLEMYTNTSVYTLSNASSYDVFIGTAIKLTIYIYAGQVFDNLKFKISVEYSATTMSSFQPYIGYKYPIRIEDSNNVLHTLGENDYYDRDNNIAVVGWITYNIKPYSGTFLYNAKPTQVEADEVHVYTDSAVQPTISCSAVSY